MKHSSAAPAGVLEYYGPDGKVQSRVSYTDGAALKERLEQDMDRGVLVQATVFARPGQGPCLSAAWFQDRVSSLSARLRIVSLPGRRARKTQRQKQQRAPR